MSDVPRSIFEKIEAFVREWPDSPFGLGHIVLADFNWEPEHIQWCLDRFEEDDKDDTKPPASAETVATRAFLRELLPEARLARVRFRRTLPIMSEGEEVSDGSE